jgi:hypothetical protein
MRNHTNHYVLDTQPPSLHPGEDYVKHYTNSSGNQKTLLFHKYGLHI